MGNAARRLRGQGNYPPHHIPSMGLTAGTGMGKKPQRSWTNRDQVSAFKENYSRFEPDRA
jgi:hypothetical protein